MTFLRGAFPQIINALVIKLPLFPLLNSPQMPQINLLRVQVPQKFTILNPPIRHLLTVQPENYFSLRQFGNSEILSQDHTENMTMLTVSWKFSRWNERRGKVKATLGVMILEAK